MVTDGRFSSLFACLTWKRSPTERLLAPRCGPPRFARNAYRKRDAHAGIGHQYFQTRRRRRYRSGASLEGGCGCQEREPSNRPRNYLRLLANSLYKLVNNLLHFWSPVQLLFFEAFPGFSLPLILQPPFMLEHRASFWLKITSLHFRSPLSPNNYLDLRKGPLLANTLTLVR